jgi:hypothetical protein
MTINDGDVRRAFEADAVMDAHDVGAAWSSVDRRIAREPRRRALLAIAGTTAAVLIGAVVVPRLVGEPHPSTPPPAPTKAPTALDSASPTPPATAVPPASPTAVPWIATPYDGARRPAIEGTVPDPSAPRCTASDIAIAQVPAPAFSRVPGYGPEYPVSADIAVVARQGRRCGLYGDPFVQLLDASGRIVASTAEPHESFRVQPYVLLEGNARAASLVHWGGQHCSGRTATHMRIRLPGDRSAIRAAITGESPPCTDRRLVGGSLFAGEFRPPQLKSNGPLTDPLTRVRVRIHPPSNFVREGSELRYQVELVALPGVGPVALSPDRCPAYRQQLRTSAGVIASEELALNCAAAPRITTAGVFFDMRMRVPAKIESYDVELTWESNIPGMKNNSWTKLIVRRD